MYYFWCYEFKNSLKKAKNLRSNQADPKNVVFIRKKSGSPSTSSFPFKRLSGKAISPYNFFHIQVDSSTDVHSSQFLYMLSWHHQPTTKMKLENLNPNSLSYISCHHHIIKSSSFLKNFFTTGLSVLPKGK